eukprot:TRINITY_DN259_c0_g1_i1.p1 TRINITY_DN259_c0_g1~~TRINITY_DN259_c0_g1_i1.p1  ORF type:complete len:349 (-),score=12.33 TRINITY_DN259_c0_g1_i1:939-1985(-)
MHRNCILIINPQQQQEYSWLPHIKYKKTMTSIAATAIKRFTKPIILMVGAPGTGKSTISQQLSQDLRIPLFSSGSYLRSLINSPQQTPLVKSLRESMKIGNLVDSSVISRVIENRLMEEQNTESKGIIFDGCPRTKVEVEELVKIADIKAAIYLYIKEDILLEKLAGRRECEKCRRTYNFAKIRREGYDFEPLLPNNNMGKCDNCGGKLVKREDDGEMSTAQRMKEYYTKTYPLIGEFYEKEGIVRKVVMYKGIREYPLIKSIVLKELSSNFYQDGQLCGLIYCLAQIIGQQRQQSLARMNFQGCSGALHLGGGGGISKFSISVSFGNLLQQSSQGPAGCIKHPCGLH